jgi:hypothetical protein
VPFRIALFLVAMTCGCSDRPLELLPDCRSGQVAVEVCLTCGGKGGCAQIGYVCATSCAASSSCPRGSSCIAGGCVAGPFCD